MEPRLPGHAGGLIGYALGPLGMKLLGFAGSGVVWIVLLLAGMAWAFRFSWGHLAERIGERLEQLREQQLEKREIKADGKMAIDSTRLDAALDRPAEMTRLFGATSDSPTLKGFGLKLDAFADGLVASGGTLSTRTASLRSAIQRNEKEMDKVVDRASRAEARYLAQYNAMDAAVSRMNSLNAYVAQQVTLWNKSSG